VKLSRVLLLIAAFLAFAGAAFAWYPPFRYFALVVAGRSPQCPMAQAVRVERHERELTTAKDRILAASKLVQHDENGFDLWDTPSGRYWIPAGDKESYMLPFNLAEQAVRIYGTGAQGVHAGDVVFDCGANVGVFTRVALDAGASKIIAIEPAPENLECLRRNYKAEIAAGRVIVIPKGVWDKEDVLSLRIDPKNSAADSFVIQRATATSTIQVPLTTVDKLVTDLKLDKVDYIKMDIEGAEPNALTGAHDTIAKWKPRISISAYHRDDHPVRIPKIIFAARPDYQMECGPCAEANARIRPDILWFR
jgi:FkbM family methyltransferase